jgi:hypothetical protein
MSIILSSSSSPAVPKLPSEAGLAAPKHQSEGGSSLAVPHSDFIDSNLTDSDTDAFSSLAQLSPASYDRLRKREGKRLGIRVETLDAEVARLRAQMREDEILHSALLILNSPQPWAESVDGPAVLSAVSARFLHYLVCPPGAADAFTLWTAHTHAFAAFLQSPRLNISSPEPGCGKTTTLDLLATLTPRPLRTENLTAPVLFRLVDQYQPTLLLDEVDAWLWQAEELRGLLNAGHKRGACAYRCEGDGNAVRPFKAFAPAALAGIGSLPGTLHDRSIFIPLAKAEPGQVTARLDDHRTEIEKDLCRKLARWAADNFAALKSCDPPLPPTAFNRLADNWRPLFAVAQIAGGNWPSRALTAFDHLTVGTRSTASQINPVQSSRFDGSRFNGSHIRQSCSSSSSSSSSSQNFSIQNSAFSIDLLAAIHSIFAASGTDRLTTKQLLSALQNSALLTQNSKLNGLCTQNSELHRLRSSRDLARLLAPSGIKSTTVRAGKIRAKGYLSCRFPRRTIKSSPGNPARLGF